MGRFELIHALFGAKPGRPRSLGVSWPSLRRERAADAQTVATLAIGFDLSACGGDDVLDDRKARGRCLARYAPSRRGRSARTGGADLLRRHPDPVVGGVSTAKSPAWCTVEGETRAVSGVSDRVLGQVLADMREHARPQRHHHRVVSRPRPSSRPRARRRRRDRRSRSHSTGTAAVWPSETTSLPLSSSERNRISSISAPAFSTSALAWSIRPRTSAPGRSAESRSARIRASGVLSSCETAAVKPVRSSSKLRSYTRSSPFRNPDKTGLPTIVRAWPRS